MSVNSTAATGFQRGADVYERARPSYPRAVLGDAIAIWVEAYSAIVHAHDPGTAYEQDLDYAPLVAANGSFTPLERTDADNPQPGVTVDIVVQRALSTSYVASADEAVQAQVERDIRALLAGFDEPFDLPYVTKIYRCTRS